jgi:hypothetical protein
MDPEHDRRYLYHYTTADTAFAKTMATGQLRLSPYAKMRDPLEAGRLVLGSVFPTTDAATDGQREANYLLANYQISRLRENSKLLAFSGDADSDKYRGSAWAFGRGWARARMWEQYADRGKGVCLAFDFERLQPLIIEQMHRRDPRSFDGPVSYTEEGVVGTPAAELHPEPGLT